MLSTRASSTAVELNRHDITLLLNNIMKLINDLDLAISQTRNKNILRKLSKLKGMVIAGGLIVGTVFLSLHFVKEREDYDQTLNQMNLVNSTILHAPCSALIDVYGNCPSDQPASNLEPCKSLCDRLNDNSGRGFEVFSILFLAVLSCCALGYGLISLFKMTDNLQQDELDYTIRSQVSDLESELQLLGIKISSNLSAKQLRTSLVALKERLSSGQGFYQPAQKNKSNVEITIEEDNIIPKPNKL